MLPTDWRDVPQQFIGNVARPLTQMNNRATEINCVPVNNGADNKIETGCSESLAVVGTIADFTAFMEKDCALQFVGSLPFIQASLAASTQRRAGIPLNHEQGAFNAADFS